MSVPLTIPGKEKNYELLPGPNKDWEWGGFEFAGGEVWLGENIDLLRMSANKSGVLPEDVEVRNRLGGLLLTSVGLGSKDICLEINGSDPRPIDLAVINTGKLLGVPQRHMQFAAAVRKKALVIERFGPALALVVSPRMLIKLGLIARVRTDYVGAAYGLEPRSLTSEITRVRQSHDIKRMSGLITAAMVTKQLGQKTCIPLLHSDNAPGGVVPIMAMDRWDALVSAGSRTQEDFVDLFKTFELGKIRSRRNKLFAEN